MDDIPKIKFLTIDTTDLEKATKAIEREKIMKQKTLKGSKAKLLNCQERYWLKRSGKRKYIPFDDNTRHELRKYFISMDSDGSKSIGVNELLEPLIALGLVENRDEVQKLFHMVDSDSSGKIEFEEFLKILKIGENTAPMIELFRKMASGQLVEDANLLPFQLIISSYRRRMLMDAVMSEDLNNKTKGEKIFKAYSKQLDYSRS